LNKDIYSLNKKITKEDINKLPLNAYTGEIVLVDSDVVVIDALEALSRESLLGFDTESKPVFKKGVANNPPSLLQLASESTVYLFQLGKLTDHAPIFDLLGNKSIIKAGVAIDDDIVKLRLMHEFTPEGFIEIGNMATELGMINTGVRSLAAILFQFRISKNVQVSNWAKSELSESQISYAATDAWVSRKIYLALNEMLSR